MAVRIGDERLIPEVELRLPPGWRPMTEAKPADRVYSICPAKMTGGSSRDGWVLMRETVPVATSSKAIDVLTAFESDVQQTVAEFSRPVSFVHAGMVGWRGRAIVLPGRSGAGKSSLVHALLRAGAEYGSDEYAVFDAAGRVHAFPRQLTPTGPSNEYAPPRIERFVSQPLDMALVFAAEYTPERPSSPSPLTPGATVLELLKNCPSMRAQKRAAMTTLANASAGTKGYSWQRGDADRSAQQLLSLADEVWSYA